jgi:AGZA family xanthine/uracil permease-like MFS transporter
MLTWARQNRWCELHDINACFALMLDSMVNLAVLASILVSFGFPPQVIFLRMLPGSTFGVLVGNVLYTLLAVQLGARRNDPTVTSMPLGLDTPSTIGMALAVLGPSFVATKTSLLAAGVAPAQAALQAADSAWGIGVAMMLMMGIVKTIASFAGKWIGDRVPKAGLLGSVGGIGLALLSFLPLLEIFHTPEVGLVCLGLIIYTLIARIPLPWHLPGAGVAVLVGTILYYVLGPMGLLSAEPFVWPDPTLHWTPPLFTLTGIYSLKAALPYLPLALPFGLLTIVGGINASASARAAGDDFETRDILLAEAFATLCASFFGGVAQSTPYIGHPAYKRMGARAGYTLLAGVMVGMGGIFGLVSFVVQALPLAAIMPVMVFVGFEIAVQAFLACPRRHAPAVVAAFLPIIANLLLIRQDTMAARLETAIAAAAAQLQEHTALVHQIIRETRLQMDGPIIVGLGHGFIVTAMFWGAFVALTIDRQLRQAAAFVGIMSLMTLCGVIHSMADAGDLYWPWQSPSPLSWHWAAGYAGMALMLWALSYTKGARTSPVPSDHAAY